MAKEGTMPADDPNRDLRASRALDLNALSLDEVEELLAAGRLEALPAGPAGERAACVPPDDEEPCFSCEPHRPWPDDWDDPA